MNCTALASVAPGEVTAPVNTLVSVGMMRAHRAAAVSYWDPVRKKGPPSVLVGVPAEPGKETDAAFRNAPATTGDTGRAAAPAAAAAACRNARLVIFRPVATLCPLAT